MLLALQRGFIRLVLFQRVQIFQEQEPGGLFGIVEFRGATGLFSEDIIDIFKGLFKHEKESRR